MRWRGEKRKGRGDGRKQQRKRGEREWTNTMNDRSEKKNDRTPD